MNSLKKKRFWANWRMPHVFTLLFALIVMVGVLSLIMSYAGASYVDSNGIRQKIIGAGILNWITAIPAGMVHAVWVIVFLFVLGAFINVIVQSQALEALMGRLGLKMKGIKMREFRNKTGLNYYLSLTGEFFRHTWVIFPLVVFFAFAGTSYGMAEESLAFYAIIIPLTMASGFDMWTGFLIVFAGAGIGVMASTINPFSVLTANSTMLDSATAGVNKTQIEAGAASGVAWRWVTWVLFTTMTALFVMVYAFRVKHNQAKAKFKDMFEIHNKEFGQSAVDMPVLTKRRVISAGLFILTFIILVIGMLQWDNIVGSKVAQSDIGERTLTNYEKIRQLLKDGMVDKKMVDGEAKGNAITQLRLIWDNAGEGNIKNLLFTDSKESLATLIDNKGYDVDKWVKSATPLKTLTDNPTDAIGAHLQGQDLSKIAKLIVNYDTVNELSGSTAVTNQAFANKNASSWFLNETAADKMGETVKSGDGWVLSWKFGEWYWGAICALFLISTIAISMVNRNSEQQFMKTSIIGAKDMLAVGLAVGISRGVSVLLSSTNLENYFAQKLGNTLGSIEGKKTIAIPVVAYILFIPLTLIIPSTSGLASATFGVIGPALVEAKATSAISGTVTAYAMGSGFANMFVPTYAVVIGAISITKISFSRFIKSIGSFLVLAFFAGLMMIIIGGAITTPTNQIF